MKARLLLATMAIGLAVVGMAAPASAGRPVVRASGETICDENNPDNGLFFRTFFYGQIPDIEAAPINVFRVVAVNQCPTTQSLYYYSTITNTTYYFFVDPGSTLDLNRGDLRRMGIPFKGVTEFGV